jgi:hypothetical protein
MKNSPTHALILLLFLLSWFAPASLSGQIIWSEDFETNGEGTRYLSPHLFFDHTNVDDYWGRIEGEIMTYADPPSPGSTIAIVGQGANNNQLGQYTGYHGSFYFAGEDLDDVGGQGNPDGSDEKELLIEGIDISGQAGLVFKGLFAAGTETACGDNYYDADDYIKVYYSIDGGPFTLGVCFNADLFCSNPGNAGKESLHYDPNCDGDGGEGTMLLNQFYEFSFLLPSGSSLDLKLVVHADDDGEEIAFDYLRVESSGAPPPCTDPVITAVNKSGDLCEPGDPVTLTVTGSLNDADNWYWYTGSCGQTFVATGNSITVNPATTTTYFVRGEPGCNGALPCSSITVSVQSDPEPPVLQTPPDVILECDESTGPPAITCGPLAVLNQGLTIGLPASGSVTLPASVFDRGSQDECGTTGLTFSFSPNAGNTSKVYNCAQLGTHPVNIWVTDGDGNQHSATTEITVQDPANYCANGGGGCQPVPVLFSSLTVHLRPDGTVTLQASDWDAGSQNVCQAGNLTFSFSSSTSNQSRTFTCADLGAQTLEIWVTDGALNQSRATVSVEVQDGAGFCNNPTATCKQLALLHSGIVINLPTDRVATLPASIFNAGSSDECNTGGLNFAFVTPNPSPLKNFTCADLGVQTEEIRVIDANGYVMTLEVTIHVMDREASCDGPGFATATDNCDPDPVVSYSDQSTPGACAGEEVITRTWTATDNAGNAATAVQTITLEDTTPPDVICPDDQIESLGPNCAFVLPNYVSLLSAGDNCSVNLTFSQTPQAGQSLNASTTVVVNVADECGNTTTCIFQLTLEDNSAPTVECPPHQTVTPNGNCEYIMGDYTSLAVATDNCDANPGLTQIPSSGTLLTGTATVTITATDAAGNESSCTFEVTPSGGLEPYFSFTPADITVGCEDEVPGNQGVEAFDDCEGEIQVFFSQTGLPLNCPGMGTVTNTWTATDSDGNTISHTQIVTVMDTTDPGLSSYPQDITVSCLAEVPGSQGVMAIDDCEGTFAPVFIQSPLPSCAGSGVVTNTWLAQDCVGNSVVHIQTVTILDQTPPVFSSTPGNISVSCAGNVPGAQGITATDNCGQPIQVVFTQTGLPLSCAGQGTVTNTWTATDCAGNTATHVQTVTVDDNVEPTLSAYPLSGTVSCIDDAPGNPGTTATDNCGGAVSVVFTQVINSTCPGSGTVTNTWTATDCAGNTETHTQVITVLDVFDPVLSAYPADITVTCIGEVPGDPGITATDNCDDEVEVVFNQTINSSCPGSGTATNTWTATDCVGNSIVYTQNILIDDNEAPVFSAYPSNITVSCASQVPGAQGLTATDNCGGAIQVNFSQSPLPACSGNGAVVNTWTAADCAGNTATWTQTVTIDDNTPPVLSSLPGNITVACEDEIPGTQGITATDNCGQPIQVVFTQTGLPLNYPNPSVVTNTWTATDCAGNTVTHSQTITVDDNEAPVAECRNITVSLDNNGEAEINPSDVDDGSTDNCGIVIWSLSQTTFTCDQIGVFPVVLTVGDLFGNQDACTALVNVVASFICPSPGISYFGGPNISDPCTCIGNGQFEEEVVVGPTGPGQIWTVVSTTLINPATMLPYPAGTPLVEHPVGGGESIYTLAGIHLDGVGYNIQVSSPSFPGLTLSISNVCYYPDPQILGLGGPFCIYSDPVTLEGDVNGVELVSEVFTIDGEPATVFDPFDLGVGTYLVAYTVDAGAAMPGDPNDPGCVVTVSQTVQVLPTPSTLACNDLVTVAVDQDCEALITPDMILEGTYLCYDDYSVTVKKGVNTLPNPVPGSYIGQTLTVTIKHLPSGNSCWGSLILEDNLPPVFSCPAAPVQVACSGDVNSVPPPPASDNCTSVTVEIIGELYVDTDPCGDNKVILHRTWQATDTYGNESAPCLQVIEIIRPDDVDFPNDITWDCTQHDLYPSILEAVSLHPTVLALQSGINPINATGISSASVLNNTGSGVPEGILGAYCSYSYTHSDQVINGCGSTFTVVRTWTVLDWCTGLVITENEAGEDNVQIISVVDQTPPVVSVPPIQVNAEVQGAHPIPCTSQGFLPPPTVSDDCSTWSIKIFTPVGEAIYLNGQNGAQGGFIPAPGLPIGVHTIVYQVTDACNNVEEFNAQLTVADNISPVAICDEITSVTLSSDGKAVVSASVFDDGSYDNCCLDFFQVRRMTDVCGIPGNTTFKPTVTFCCADVGTPVQVVFRVYDCFGNYNDCMVTVNVEDKLPPILVSCPANQTITCEDYQEDLAAGLAQGNYSVLDPFGAPLFYDNCGVTVSQNVTVNLNNCTEGTITRTWTATDPYNNAPSTCTQVISVQHVSNWVVEFPANITANCTNGQLPPFGEPEVFFDECELVGISYEDQEFNVSSGSCYLIVRTWTAINWCLYDDYGYNAFTERNEIQANQDFDGDGDKDNRTFKDGVNNGSGPDGFITYNQTISVVDTEAPVFNVNDIDVCILETDCDTEVNLPIPLVEDCSDDITIGISTDLPNGSGFGPYADVPPGVYSALYTVTDGCNNSAYDEITIVVEDCKKPTPLCDNGLVVNIMQTGMIMVEAEMFDEGSYDNCGGPLLFSYSSDVNDVTRVWDCDDLGFQPVEIWVTDASGNQDYCSTFLLIQDNMNVCNPITLVTVAGGIEVENGNPVNNVEVDVNGGLFSMFTDYEGTFEFQLAAENDYTITPVLDLNPANGVTTLDMVFIQKHILGVLPLNSPYKIIAADANKSGAVTTVDLVVIQKVILLLLPNFPSNTSWRFVDKDHVFPNPQNPWQGGPFPEVISYNNLLVDQLFTDFVAVKVGDVNLSANTGLDDGGASERTLAGVLEFITDEQELDRGDEFTLTLRTRPSEVLGYQFTLDFPAEAIEWLDMMPGLVSEENIGWVLADEGALTTNFFSPEATRLDEKTVLFQLKGRALQRGRLSEWLRISSRFTPAEAYDGDGQYLDLRLLFEGAAQQEAGFALYQNQPNPFRHETLISFELPGASHARLTVYDASGRVLNLVEGPFKKGFNEIQLGPIKASGVLYYKLETPAHVAVKKMVSLE